MTDINFVSSDELNNEIYSQYGNKLCQIAMDIKEELRMNDRTYSFMLDTILKYNNGFTNSKDCMTELMDKNVLGDTFNDIKRRNIISWYSMKLSMKRDYINYNLKKEQLKINESINLDIPNIDEIKNQIYCSTNTELDKYLKSLYDKISLIKDNISSKNLESVNLIIDNFLVLMYDITNNISNTEYYQMRRFSYLFQKRCAENNIFSPRINGKKVGFRLHRAAALLKDIYNKTIFYPNFCESINNLLNATNLYLHNKAIEEGKGIKNK